MKGIFNARNLNHIDKLNKLSKEVLISARIIQKNNNIEKDFSGEMNYKINNIHLNLINPNVKRKMSNILTELSLGNKALSSNQSKIYNYNFKAEKKNIRYFSSSKSQIEFEKKHSIEKKKKEIFSLLTSYNEKSNRNQKVNLISLQKNINKNENFAFRMKSEINKILNKSKNPNNNIKKNSIVNSKDLKINIENNIKSRKKIKHKRNLTFSLLNDNITKENNTFETMKKIKFKYGLK